jgi:myo-inositol-1(or 4)-monophosphatase
MDGTHNYLRGNPFFSVSIGLKCRRASQDCYVAGVIYFPYDNVTYLAEEGKGAWRDCSGGDFKRIRVSSCSELNKATVSMDSNFRYMTKDKLNLFKKITPNVFNVRMSGSCTRDMTFIADGTSNLSLGYSGYIWDYAAAVPLIREAGGQIFSNGLCCVAGNGLVNKEALKLSGLKIGNGLIFKA